MGDWNSVVLAEVESAGIGNIAVLLFGLVAPGLTVFEPFVK
jgi:hypothetical protein